MSWPITFANLSGQIPLSNLDANFAYAVNLNDAQTLTNKVMAAATNTIEAKSGPNTTPFSFRNLLMNADFRINQRAYVSAAVLAAGVYGHDRWKAGASGGDYSFTQLKSSTQITIASGKSLIQVIEDANVAGGNYVLSWTGTSLARFGLNSATPSGSYSASPILITGQTAGTVMSVEFNNGTVGTVQIESGAIATPFEIRNIGFELDLCHRYFELVSVYQRYDSVLGGTNATGSQSVGFRAIKRTAPTCVVINEDNAYSAFSGFVTGSVTSASGLIAWSNGLVVVARRYAANWSADAEL